MIIMKFGGTSVKDASAIKNVSQIIQKELSRKPVIVVSAFAGITNLLLKSIESSVQKNYSQGERIINEIRNRHLSVVENLFKSEEALEKQKILLNHQLDKLGLLLKTVKTLKLQTGSILHAIMSIGEILSSNIISSFLETNGINCCLVDSRSIIKIETSNDNNSPLFDEIILRANRFLKPKLQEYDCIICAGFIGSTLKDEPATLGRNGSDYTASLLGAAIDADEIQIWSDVDGILSADPSIIPYAKPLKQMSFNEACELAYFGARVLHPATIQPALEKDIPVRVLNSNKPEFPGTLITKNETDDKTDIIKSIAYKENITLLNVESAQLLLSPKIVEEIFLLLTQHGKKVYAVSKSATKLSITLENHSADLQVILQQLSIFGEVTVDKGKVILSVVGEKMQNDPSIPWRIIKTLEEEKIKTHLISQFANQISLTFIIDEKNIEKTVKLLHSEFIEN